MTSPRRWTALAATAALALAAGALMAPAEAASSAPTTPLTNLAHLDFLLDTASPTPVAGHTTYRLAEEPELTMPWTYADARDGGRFERVGGGRYDAATNTWAQGAYNSDDISRAAVVYLRHWKLTANADSRDKAYELLRALAYLQTTEGEHAGNVVLWMQPDGSLNPSAEPVELPDPSDSGPSYWTARTLWAFGEGYAAFADADPAFAAFLADRIDLARAAVDREVLDTYGQYTVSDGVKVPSWLIVDAADASAEAVLGLASYVEASGDPAARETTRKLAEGIAAMGSADTRSFPFGAIRPWAQSPAVWHAWASQMPAALAVASTVLGDQALLKPAVTDSVSFTTTLLTAGGADNGWQPSPTDRTQIAYGVDSRIQSLLAVSEAGSLPGLDQLAAVQASWYFGANRAGEPMYDPATGVTYDGLQSNGAINRNSGAESTIHGLLSMIALDAHPQIGERARATTQFVSNNGLTVVEAESATSTTGTVSTPADSWTGESQYSGSVLTLTRGQSAQWKLAGPLTARIVSPVSWRAPGQSASSLWSIGILPAGFLDHSGVEQGISPTPGALLPGTLTLPALGTTTLKVTAASGTVVLDDLIVRPVVSRLTLGGAGSTELVQAVGVLPQLATVGVKGKTTTVAIYDSRGALTSTRSVRNTATVLVPAGGFALATR